MHHRPWVHRLLAGLLLGFLLLSGCDEQPAPLPEPPPAEPKADAHNNAPPTTQALLEGPRKSLYLQLVPFSIQAPESWKLVQLPGGETSITMIEGPVIDDEVHVSVNLRESVSGMIVNTWLDKVEREHAEAQGRGGVVKVQKLPDDGYIIERRVPVGPTTRPAGAESVLPAVMEWRFTMLVPRGIKYEQYELKFLGLTLEAFKKNEKLLVGIFDTLKPEKEPELPPLPAL